MPARLTVKQGDLLNEAVDVIVSTANPSLLMSGGVNGAILMRGGHDVQSELQDHFSRIGRKYVEPGTVVVTKPGPLKCKYILHAVSINAFYESSVELVATTVVNVFKTAIELEARSIAIPALATGYGPLSIKQFAEGVRNATTQSHVPLPDDIRIVIWREQDFETFRDILNKTK